MVFYSPQPPAFPPPQSPKKKDTPRTLFIIGVCIFALIVVVPIINGTSSPYDSTTVASTEPSAVASAEQSPAALADEKSPAVRIDDEEKPAEETTFAMGQPVTTKKFEYVTTGYECGIPSVGEYEVTKEVAKGQFCRLSITAKNIATKAETLDFDDFKLMLGEIEYSTDSWVNIKASNDTDSSGFLDKINPGLLVTGSIYFDVPTDVTPNIATIDDTFFGKPATVTLK